MAYTPYYTDGWADSKNGGTPITADALNHMDTGITEAFEEAGNSLKEAKSYTDEKKDSLAEDIAALNVVSTDRYYNTRVNLCTNVDQVNALFKEWWESQYVEGTTERVDLLERWFGTVLDDDKVHGVKLPLFATSTTAIGELTDDSEGLSCTPSTEDTAGQDDFAHLPQFWCVEASAEKNSDGSITVYAVEGIDDIADVRSGEHLCWVFQKNTYCREWDEDGYRMFKTQCREAEGYAQWPDGKTADGTMHAFMAHPKYYAGLDADGLITCGTGLAPINYTSHTSGVSLWRKRGSMYSGGAMLEAKFLLRMMWLKYAKKSNSGTIEGCSAYSYQYKAAVAETGVSRIILTTSEAANFFVGSNVIVGEYNGSSTDRNTASNYSICKNVKITAIEDVEIDETTYSAVYVDIDSTFDTIVDTTMISTMPYYSGWNDDVQGNDGSRYSYTTGKEPGLLQKIEFQNGSHMVMSNELWQWSTDDDGNYTFDCYVCDVQANVASAISSSYEKQEDLTLTFPSDTTAAWEYVEDTAINEKTLWPASVSTSAGSGTGCKAGFYVNPSSSAVRAAWVWAALYHGGYGGLAARSSDRSVSHANWDGSLGAPGLAG